MPLVLEVASGQLPVASEISLLATTNWQLATTPMLIDPLFAHAKDRPDEIALIDDRGQCTYRQLAVMAIGMSGRIVAPS